MHSLTLKNWENSSVKIQMTVFLYVTPLFYALYRDFYIWAIS